MISFDRFKEIVEFYGSDESAEDLWASRGERIFLLIQKFMDEEQYHFAWIHDDACLGATTEDILEGDDYGWRIHRLVNVDTGVPTAWTVWVEICEGHMDTIYQMPDAVLWETGPKKDVERFLRRNNITQDDLDDLVCEMVSNAASNVNNEGLDGQVAFFLKELGDDAVKELEGWFGTNVPREERIR